MKNPKSGIHLLLSSVLGLSSWMAAITGAEPHAAVQAETTVRGVVTDEAGVPMSGARVRIQATANVTVTCSDGTFELSGLRAGFEVKVTAWKADYYVAKRTVTPPATNVSLALKRYPEGDNPDYEWLLPLPAGGLRCITCHIGPVMSQGLADAHANAGTNPRFFSMYNGTDVAGHPGIGPGYKLDFPSTAGICAACHAPGAAANHPFTADMNALRGADTFGIHCDYCHKVGGVYLDPATGLPYPNVPGVLSMDLRRPAADKQIFFGPFDDIEEPDTLLPLIRQSQFCAPCHNFSFWGTPIYQSFAEWLASPYPARGVQCQTCHMPPDGVTTNFAPGHGGQERDPKTIPTHYQFGASHADFLSNTVTMTLSVRQSGSRITATVDITNDRAGHHVPTDHPARNMILLVTARDARGSALSFSGGTVVPAWGGDVANLPGKGFAKILRDVQTGESPVANYWKQTLIESDNRIAALATDTSSYVFDAPQNGGIVSVEAKLVFRRAFKALSDQKGWQMPDITMAEKSEQLMVPATPGKAILLTPIGTVAARKPTFLWRQVPGATWYFLWVNQAGVPRIQTWYTSEQAGCGSGTGNCSATPDYALSPGLCQWWIQTWNEAGYGPWSDAMAFTVIGGPGQVTLVSPSGTIGTASPPFVWNAASEATWYYLWVNDSAGNIRIQRWYTAEQAGCARGSNPCSVASPISLHRGGAIWWIQSWNPEGYGPWSIPLTFSVEAPGPP